jgi:hypothetical protein
MFGLRNFFKNNSQNHIFALHKIASKRRHNCLVASIFWETDTRQMALLVILLAIGQVMGSSSQASDPNSDRFFKERSRDKIL